MQPNAIFWTLRDPDKCTLLNISALTHNYPVHHSDIVVYVVDVDYASVDTAVVVLIGTQHAGDAAFVVDVDAFVDVVVVDVVVDAAFDAASALAFAFEHALPFDYAVDTAFVVAEDAVYVSAVVVVAAAAAVVAAVVVAAVVVVYVAVDVVVLAARAFGVQALQAS